MAEYCITHLAGNEVWLLGSKLVWIPSQRLLCAADIHFEKSTFFGRFATFLPPYDTRETLARLAEGVMRFRPEIFVALGDSFHDAEAGSRLSVEDSESLAAIIDSVPRFVWITGNHDPAIAETIRGERHDEMMLAGIAFRHEWKRDCDSPEMSGHFHPKASITARGRKISAPCFARAGERLIVPSFGSFTGGLDVNHPELQARLPQGGRHIYLAHQGRTYLVHENNY